MARSTLLVLSALLAAGCSFDASSLGDRPPCDTDDDCESGFCVEGSCWDPTSVGGDDADPVDVGDAGADADADGDADAPLADGQICSPGEQRCDGTLALTCDEDGADWTTDDCTATTACASGTCACEAGVCVDTGACSDDEVRCSGDVAQRCEGGVWIDDQSCPEGTCRDGACVGTCEPGELSCEGERLIGCNDDGIAVVQADCAASAAYCDTDPDPHCEPQTCEPGTYRCAGTDNATETCSARGDAWLDGDACSDDQVCEDGTCVDLDCDPGARWCTGPLVYATCGDDGQSSVISSCPEDTYCVESADGEIACEDQICDPGDRRCADDTEAAEVCDVYGAAWSVTIPCDRGEFCREGICTEQVCTPSTQYCVTDTALLACDPRGALEVMTPCPDDTYCDDTTSACVDDVCVPDTVRCGSGNRLEVCNAIGSEFEPGDACAAGTTCTEGACVDLVCTPSELGCSDDFTVEECNSLGTEWSYTACGDDSYCDSGACVDQVCEPGTRSCDGDAVLACNDAGSGASVVETCDLECVDGACTGGVCGDGSVNADGEECDDGNDDPCDGCDACKLESAIRITSATRTTNDVGWTPATSDFTIEAWVRATAAGALFGIGDRTDEDYAWVGVESGRAVFEYALGESGPTVRVTGSSAIGGAWHHIAVQRFDGQGAAIFVDGVLDAFTHEPFGLNSLDARHFWVGSDGNTTPATAEIDELHFSSTRRYGLQFTPSPRATADGFTLGLYRADEASAGRLVDGAGTARHIDVSSSTRVADACYGADADERACGDGGRAPWEECDDGNTTSGDDCSATCLDEVCPENWLRGYDDTCYRLISPRDWEDARSWCRDRDAELVTINDELENDWLNFFLDLNEAHWIALNDRGITNEGRHYWSGGSSDYRNWGSGQPDDGSGWDSEDCVSIVGPAGDWNDRGCGSDLRAICED